MKRPPLNPFSLSVFFPCHNEEANVESVTREAVKVASSVSSDYEVIIVDDGSKDATPEIAKRLVDELPNVRHIRNPTNLGYGGALQAGFRSASKNWVFYTDGDGQFDLSELPKLIPLLSDCDIVSGYRIVRQDPFHRKVFAFGWGNLVNLMFGLRLRDVDCAFKIYPRSLFDEITMESRGALIDTEILAKAKRRGYKIKQIGVKHLPRRAGQQSGGNIKVIARAFKELLALRKKIASEKPGAAASQSKQD